MKYTSFEIDAYNASTSQKIKFDKGYVFKFENDDLFFLAVNVFGPSKEIICDMLNQLKIELDDIDSFFIIPSGEDNVIYEIYLFPKSIPKNVIQNTIQDIHNKMIQLGFYDTDSEEDDDEEYDEYCYKLNNFSEIPKIPTLRGTIIKDYDNQKYLITDQILHDFLDESDMPKDFSIVLEDITKIMEK